MVGKNSNWKSADQALARLFVRQGLITAEQIPQVRDERGLIRALVDAKFIDEQQALSVAATATGATPYNPSPEALDIATKLVDDQLLKAVELKKWQQWLAAPVRFNDMTKTLTIAVTNPLDVELKQTVEFSLGMSVALELASDQIISGILSKQINAGSAFKLENILVSSSGRGGANSGDGLARPLAAAEQAVGEDRPDSPPIVRLVNKILAESVSRGASDIHIEPQSQELDVRVRVNGIMETLFSVPASFAAPVASRLKLLCGLDIAEKRKPQDGRLRIRTPLGPRDIRLSTVPTAHGESLVARILAGDAALLNLETLGLPEHTRKKFERTLRSSARVVLVTGPTGSGKTSSLYAGLQTLANGERNIVTIEDPIEYRIPGINQIQINPKVGLTFAEGLRSIVRQDPDVVMVGEVRDQETARIAMQTAQTGHLVLSTMHTNSAAGAVTRLKDLGIPSYMISSSLGAVMAQRLVRTLCSCSAPLDPADQEHHKNCHVDPAKARVPAGCDACNHSGYRGRTGIYSLLEITPAISEAIRADKGESEFERIAREQGEFVSLADAARVLIEAGKTSLEEVERVLGPLDAPEHQVVASVDGVQEAIGQLAGKRKILLVEDDENTRSILTMLFEREFYDVVPAGNGVEGLERLHEHQPDIVICDLMMPQMSGLQMLKKIRNDSRTREVPILMLTAAASEENELKLIEDGANDFVSKTADSRILVARVERLLRDA